MGRLSKLEIKRVLLILIPVSLILNIGHIFQYTTRGYDVMSASQYRPVYAFSYSYPAIIEDNAYFSVYLCAYTFLNFVVFLLFNTIVKVTILRKLQKELLEKRKRLEQMNQIDTRTKRKLEMDNEKELRALTMVVTNSFLNFFLRLPEILVFISSTNSIFNILAIANLDRNLTNFDALLVDVSYLIFILTFITNMHVLFIQHEVQASISIMVVMQLQ